MGRQAQRRARRRDRALRFEPLEDRWLMAVDWRNPVNSLDVSGDGFISPLDALQPINELNDNGSHALADQRPSDKLYWDASGDQFISPLDALQVINALNDNRIVPYVLGEGQLIAAEQSVTITVGQTTGTRKYRLQVDANFDATDTQASSDDLLAIYLVDSQQPTTTLLDRGTPGTTLFTLSESGAEFAPGRVRWDGQIVEIDLSELTGRDTAELRLQLLNSDSDSGSRVAIRPLTNEVDVTGVIGPRLLDSTTPAAAGAAFNLTGLTAADDVSVEVANVRFSSATQRYTADLRLQNAGDSLGRSVAVVFPDLPSAVTLRNPSGTTADGDPYINFATAIGRGGLPQNGRSEPLLVEFDDPARVSFALTPQILAGTNQPPTLTAISPLTVMPGGTLSTPLSATDPDGDVVTFSLANSVVSRSPDPLTLPTGILRGDGLLEFTPVPDQLGQYTFDVIASDGALKARQTVTLDVVADPMTTTRVSGFILDMDQAPLAGLQVEIGAVQGLTQSDGSFTLDLGSGPVVGDTLKVRGELFTGNSTLVYPFIAEKLAFILEHEVFSGVNNVIARPVFLPPLDVANGAQIDPTQDETVTTPAIPGASLFIAAGTLMNQQGTPYDGVLNITEVPPELTPAALPANFLPDLVVTIQPGEMVFASPAPLTFPNTAGWEPGTLMDLWSINPVTGQFDDVGDMRVSADGSLIETISGGVRNSSWHFPAPPPEDATNPEEEDENKDDECNRCKVTADANSQVALHSGAILETHELVTYRSLGTTRGLTLHYHSERADSRPILHFGIDNARPGDDRRLVARLAFSNGQVSQQVPGFEGGMGLPGGEHFWRIPDSGGDLKVALQGDLTSLPSGVYEYTLTRGIMRIADGRFTGTTTSSSGQVVHVNAIDSPFGAGWQLGGIQQLVGNSDGSLLFIDGSGTNFVFRPVPGQPGAFTSPVGDFSTLAKNADGSFTRTLKDQTVYQFDTVGRLVSMTDRNGNTTERVYEEGRLVRIVDPVGLQTTFIYTGDRAAEIVEPAGRITRLEYDAAGNLIRITDPDGSSRAFEYDSDHHIIAEVDQLERREQTHFGFHGRATGSIRKDGSTLSFDPVQTRVLLAADATINPLDAPFAGLAATEALARTADANSSVTTTLLDKAGQAVRVFDAVGSMGGVTRNNDNLVAVSTDARGFDTAFTYDERGNVLSVTDEVARRSGGSLFPGEKFAVGDRPFAVTTGDFNGDGVSDLAIANFVSNDISVLRGNGDGTFAAQQVFTVGSNPTSVTTGDFNGDGVSDLAVANGSSNDVSVLLGNGDGTFATQQRVAVEDDPQSVTTGDFNGDGVSDLAVANGSSNDVSVLLGNGDGTFADQQRFTVGSSPESATTGDFNGDGVSDLAVANLGSSDVSVLLGNGDGTFADQQPFAVGVAPRFVTTGDFDGDGVSDLAVANYTSGDVSVLLGNGDGTFADQQSFAVGDDPQSVTTGDFNGDGASDLVVANLRSNDVSVLLGNGDGTFADQQSFAVGVDPQSVTTGDFNGDGVSDLAVANGFSNDVSVLLGDGGGAFAVQQRFGVGIGPVSGETDDFNGDGLSDLTVANVYSDDVSVLLGNGDGTFADQQPFAVGDDPDSVTTGDFNGDGVRDLAVANLGSGDVSVLLGNGDGTFADQQRLPVGDGHFSVTTGDFDGDGVSDLAVANYISDDVSVLIGNGDGTFADQQRFAVGNGPLSITTGDFDGDGVSDLAIANFNDVSVLLGNGDGTFADQQRFAAGDGAVSVTTGDFNGDGVSDLAVVNDFTYSVSVLLSNGDGTFADRQSFAEENRRASVTTGDFDGDGVSDLAIANGFSNDVSVLLGNGDGTFADQQRFAVGNGPRSVTTGDFNGDGVSDLAVANFNDVSVLLGRGDSGRGRVQPRTFAYDDTFSQLTRVTDELGRVTRFDIDPANGNRLATIRVVGARDSSANSETDDLHTIFTFTTSGLIDVMTDPLGRITDYDYDSLGQLVSVTFAKGTPEESMASFEYDAAGNQTAVVDENGNRSEFRYDSLNRLTQIVEADPDVDGPLTSPLTTFVYDARGNIIESTDAAGSTVVNQYDALDRLILTRDGDGNETSFTYDPNGNLVRVTDPNANTTAFTYDTRDRRTTNTDPDGGVTTYRYDSGNNLLFLTDPNGNRTGFAYDSRNRLVREVDPLGEEIRYKYDAVDNLIEKTDRNDRVIEFVYDDVDRLVAETWLNPDDSVANTIAYAYDKASNLLSVDDAFSSLAFTYDARDRVQTVDNAGTPDAPQVLLTYAYDPIGNILSVTDTINGQPGSINAYTYDALDRMTRVTQSGNGVTDKRVDLAYNELGQFASIDRYSDLEGTQLVVGSMYDYDAVNRLTSLTHSNSIAAVAFYNFTYDAASRITRITDIDGVTDYTYDDRDQLIGTDHTPVVAGLPTERPDEHYRYDANGNRLESHLHGAGYVTGPGNRLLSDGIFNYEYDHEGNFILRTEIGTGNVREFEWDHRNRLAAVIDKNASGNVIQEIEFRYDALNRRIAKAVDTTPTDVITHFVYGRDDVLLDFVDSDGAANPNPQVLARRYLHGPAVDQVFAQEDIAGNQLWHLTDHLGTVHDVADKSGTITNHLNYDSFGNVVSETQPAIDSRYLFTGREIDAEIGLYFYRSRQYQPTTGRFISEDQIRFGGGDHNLARYVHNSPTMLTDPSGYVAPLLYSGYIMVVRCFINPVCRNIVAGVASGVADFVFNPQEKFRPSVPSPGDQPDSYLSSQATNLILFGIRELVQAISSTDRVGNRSSPNPYANDNMPFEEFIGRKRRADLEFQQWISLQRAINRAKKTSSSLQDCLSDLPFPGTFEFEFDDAIDSYA